MNNSPTNKADAILSQNKYFLELQGVSKEVVRKASVAFVLKVLGAGLTFLFNILLARLLGAKGAGVYYLALTVTTVATVVGRMGMDNALLRFTAVGAAQQEWSKVAGIYRKGIIIATIASASATLLVLFGADWIAHGIFSEPLLVKPLRLMSLAILPFSLLSLHAEMLKALKRIRDAVIVQGVGVPLISLSLLAFLGDHFGVIGAVGAYVLATITVLILAVGLWYRAAPQVKKIRGDFDSRLLITTSLPLFWVASMNLVMGWTDTFMLGLWTDSRSIGIYGIAMRTAMLTSIILTSINSIVAPKFAALYANGELEKLGTLARHTTILMTLFATPILLLFIFGAKLVLGFFGMEFVKGTTVLILFSLGQFVNVITGSVGYLLIMSRYEKLMRNNIIGSALLNFSLNAALIPYYGIEGAAIATSVSLVVLNLVSVGLVYWKLSIITLPIPKRVLVRGK